MTMYGSLFSSEKSHTTKEGNQRRSSLQRTAIYQASDRKGEGEGIHLQREGNESQFSQQNFSQVPLLKAAQPASKEQKQINANGSLNNVGIAHPTTTTTTYAGTAVPIQRAEATVTATVAPPTEIDLEDLWNKVIEEGGEDRSSDAGKFVGAPGGGYPHIHVWRNGSIAISVAKNKNDVIGRNGKVDIALLKAALARRDYSPGPLRSAVEWVLASAS